MTSFFSAIQGKFKAEFHGRYLGHILEQLAAVRPESMRPILRAAPLTKAVARGTDQAVYTESDYLGTGTADRRADLEIALSREGYSGRVIVEIKMLDSFLPGQLDDYIKWARARAEDDDRAVVVLTAFPIEAGAAQTILANQDVIRHMYLSDLAKGIDGLAGESEIVGLFRDYLSEEGYSMYELTQAADNADVKALHSFMVLNFLPHASGHGKVSTNGKISRGPEVFGRLVQNWQLISARVGTALKLDHRTPTVRYFAEQTSKEAERITSIDMKGAHVLDVRRSVRDDKLWGRYWIFAESVCPNDTMDNLRVEWGQLLQVRAGGESNSDAPVECGIYALIRCRGESFGESKVWLKKGVLDPDLYHPEKLIALIEECVNKASDAAIKREPKLSALLPWRRQSELLEASA